LRATRSGVIDFAVLAHCRLRETTSFGPLHWTRHLPFPGADLKAVRLEAGQLALARESRQAVLRWSAHVVRTFAVDCD
jgi:hypothetical protein